ncbi:MAG: right-handed parallel beta-helix repeat-containing protein [Planctomycetes bacterium]|nr:right-handed parallel beta-helix repeat-containing protein [Planctomycetota bacterium]
MRREAIGVTVAAWAWLALGVAAAAAAEAPAAAALFYVSPGGNDAWTGTKPAPAGADGPLATLQAARDAARRAGPSAPRRIVVQAGTHLLAEPLTLDARDAGLSIEAAHGARPVLCGGRRLTGWQKDGDRFWSAPAPEAAAGTWDFRLLVVNGHLADRARLPETGRFKHLSEFTVRWMSSTGGGWQRKPTAEELTALRYRPEDLDPWLEPKNAEITVYHMWDESLVGVAAMDRQAHTLTLAPPTGHPPGAFGVKDYVVWNVREGLTRPGQWYLDRAAGKVVYWPLPGEDMVRAEAWAPVAASLIRVTGNRGAPVRGVTIRGLALTLTNIPLAPGGFGAGKYDGAVTLSETQDCRLADLTVYHAGGQGLKAASSDGLRVENSVVHHTGAGGIVVRGKVLEVADCLLHDVGLLCPSGIGIFGGGLQGRVIHNEVHDTSYSAVNFNGEDVLIEGNLIYAAMKVLHDGAGIYTFAPKRLVMRGNFIRDITDTGGYGASAYYLDERAEDCVVENNLALRVAWPSHNHMAVRNTIRNNVFVAEGDARITFPRSSEHTFEKNVVVAGGKITFTNPAGMTVFKGNVLWSRAGKVEGVPLADYRAGGAAPLPVTDGAAADPKLLPGVEKGVCRFAPDSPALNYGIQPVDVSGAGRRTAGPTPPAAEAPVPRKPAAEKSAPETPAAATEAPAAAGSGQGRRDPRQVMCPAAPRSSSSVVWLPQ